MITALEAAEGAARLAALKHYSGDPIARAEIGDMLMRMVGTPAQLEWLIAAMVDQVGEWPGTRELRAVFCTRYPPADGVEAWSAIPGFTAADSEAAHYRRHEELTAAEKRRELPPASEVAELAEKKKLA